MELREIEDRRWRRAASTLALALVDDDDGRMVNSKLATRANPMRGVLEGHDIVVRHDRGSTHTRVHLRRNLALGLKVQVSAPPQAPDGGYAGPGQTTVAGIEQERVEHLLRNTESGRELMS